MKQSDGSLRHLAFFEELARLDETDEAWRSVSAGLVVMRLVDAWIEEGPALVSGDSWAVSSVRSAIDEMPQTTPVRSILQSVVAAIVEGPIVDLHPVTPRLMAYAQSLQYELKFALAADVYRTIIAHAHPREESDVVVPAHIELAYCLRQLGDLEAAAEAYHRAGDVANAVGDVIGVLRARLGDAKLASARGNMPQAELILDETIQRASERGLHDVHSRALHERSYVAVVRGDFERAIRFAYDALHLATGERERDRILGDIATMFLDLGVLDVARDAYLILTATAQEEYVRWTSRINLMEIASLHGMEPLFDRYRREMENKEFPPYLRAAYLMNVGKGYQALGKSEIAIPYLDKALEFAAAHQLNQFVIEAEESLKAAHTRQRRDPVIRPDVSTEVLGIGDAIRQMKMLSGVAG